MLPKKLQRDQIPVQFLRQAAKGYWGKTETLRYFETFSFYRNVNCLKATLMHFEQVLLSSTRLK